MITIDLNQDRISSYFGLTQFNPKYLRKWERMIVGRSGSGTKSIVEM